MRQLMVLGLALAGAGVAHREWRRLPRAREVAGLEAERALALWGMALGLYFALQESINFRLAEFLWIKNLAAPDMLVYWGESIPVISSPDQSSGCTFVPASAGSSTRSAEAPFAAFSYRPLSALDALRND